MFRYFLFLIFGLNSILLPQTELMIIELQDGSTRMFNIPEIKELGLSGTTGIEQTDKIQTIFKNFVIRQNYPNPFNPATNISYHIPEAGFVEIRIFDIQGKPVRLLDNSRQAEGEHVILWNGLDDSGIQAASGTYFCYVKFNENYLVNKLLLIK